LPLDPVGTSRREERTLKIMRRGGLAPLLVLSLGCAEGEVDPD